MLELSNPPAFWICISSSAAQSVSYLAAFLFHSPMNATIHISAVHSVVFSCICVTGVHNVVSCFSILILLLYYYCYYYYYLIHWCKTKADTQIKIISFLIKT